ncbi:MAG: heavy-metal-associated domain-containing protein [Patescibacteria group bacterium]|nr:heavy-metal-associated domain-containing protein [Patescibacteria group bacterium]
MKNLSFKILGLSCDACKKLSEKRISSISGVESVKVDLGSGKTTVTAKREINLDELKKALEGTAYKIENL